MGRLRATETAAGQAAVLFMAAGVLGLASTFVPGAINSFEIRLAYGGSLLLSIVILCLPWARWDRRATLALVPAAMALVVIGRWYDPSGVETLYALWFVVIFGWVGTWHERRMIRILALPAAVAYVVPYLPSSPAASPETLASVAVAVPIAVVLAEILAARTEAMRHAQAAIEASSALLERANLTDDLTGIGNRRHANALLDDLRAGDGLVLLDLDHFKRVNDTLGHAEGDRVLMRLGRFLADSVRDADCVARFGGEEFLMVVRGAGDELDTIVRRLMAGWRATGCDVTLSAGATVHGRGAGPTDTLRRADRFLYQAKAAGRDRLIGDEDGRDQSMPV